MEVIARRMARLALSLTPMIAAVAFSGASCAEALPRFNRTYPAAAPTHLSLANVNGDVTVTTSNKREIVVSAIDGPSISVQDRVAGNSVEIWVRHGLRVGRVNFEVSLPADTALHLKNIMGKISVRGLAADLNVDALNGDVRLIDLRSPSVDVRVISGDVFFDGELSGEGPFCLQSVRGDIDVTLPASTAFSLSARALKEHINLGGFAFNFSSQQSKAITGWHSKGGPRMNLTAYDGRIILHKK
ncbi:MAG: hypothetical protein DMF61_10625 [Blastocatellia bacterium AA13]|nr:MAG: hypothetical protein DMF61_10625 [Blastocatellia bacterium AA13]